MTEFPAYITNKPPELLRAWAQENRELAAEVVKDVEFLPSRKAMLLRWAEELEALAVEKEVAPPKILTGL